MKGALLPFFRGEGPPFYYLLVATPAEGDATQEGGLFLSLILQGSSFYSSGLGRRPFSPFSGVKRVKGHFEAKGTFPRI
jgi:hypothetical protein